MSAETSTTSGCPFGYGAEDASEDDSTTSKETTNHTAQKKSFSYFLKNGPSGAACH